MRNGKLRGLLITVMLLVFLAGLASILYPYIWGAAVDSSIASTAKDFLEREEPELPATTVIIDSIKPEKVKPYLLLFCAARLLMPIRKRTVLTKSSRASES